VEQSLEVEGRKELPSSELQAPACCFGIRAGGCGERERRELRSNVMEATAPDNGVRLHERRKAL
jgi:hypothetical protein